MKYENLEEDQTEPDVLLEEIVKSLVGTPDMVEIDVTESASTTIFSIDVVPEDRGKIIGKGGRIIEALKTIFYSIGSKQNETFVLEINE